MKLQFVILSVCCALPWVSSAQERTAGGNLQQEASWGALKGLIDSANGKANISLTLSEAIAKCNSKSMFYAPDNPNKDEHGCIGGGGTVQVGTVVDTTSYTVRNVAVTFPKPFSKVPKVYLALSRYVYQDNCREDKFQTDIGASAVTTTGFVMSLGGYGRCGGRARVEKATWIAVDQ